MSRIRADQLVNRAGSGGPKFPHGVADGFSVSGIVTATSFAGNLTGNVTGNADTATTATTATNAQGLTGTPNITVGTIGCGNVTSTGDVTGVNATFSGNLTVNGTTTTIDTAVTAVDSLNVEGNVGIGTDNPSVKLHVHEGNVRTTNTAKTKFVELGTDGNIEIKRTGGGAFIDFADDITQDYDVRIQEVSNGLKFITGGSGSTSERVRITSGGTLFSYSPDDTTPNFKWRSDDTNWHGALNFSVEGSSIASFWSTGGDWSVNGTTYSCTKNVAAYPSAAIALHNQYNSSFESKFVFLNKAGGSTTTDGGVTELASISSAGVISDSIGPLRRLGINFHNAATYTLVASDAGKLIREATNGANITIPQNLFAAGDMISIFNASSGDNTITQGTGTTLYNTADGASGNRTLATKGVCTIVCTSTNEFIISGSQIS